VMRKVVRWWKVAVQEDDGWLHEKKKKGLRLTSDRV
jgi:hypothetical protein